MSHDIFFDEATHTYLVDGTKEVPSVTTVLNYLTETEYRAINKSVLEYAARRGTLVHEYCELIDYGIMPEQIEGEVVGYIRAYLDFMNTYRCQWEQIESVVYSSHGFAGTMDRAGIVDGQEAIVDIKTISSPTKLNKLSVCCQTAAYAIAREETFGVKTEKRYALYLKKDGDFNLMSCDSYEDKYGFNAENTFFDCLSFYLKMKSLGTIKAKRKEGK